MIAVVATAGVTCDRASGEETPPTIAKGAGCCGNGPLAAGVAACC